MLYVLALEQLLRALERTLAGCTLHGISIKFSAYADDLATIHEAVEDAEKSVHTLLGFEKVSNAKINLSKCQRLSKKELNLPERSILRRIEQADFTKYLGCIVAYDTKVRQEQYRCFWSRKIASINATLTRWKSSGVNLMGRILIAKSLAIGQIMYHASLMPLTKCEQDKLQETVDCFIKWDPSKRKSMARTFIGKKDACRPKYLGGLGWPWVEGIVDSALAQWLLKILDPSEEHPALLIHLKQLQTAVRKGNSDLFEIRLLRL